MLLELRHVQHHLTDQPVAVDGIEHVVTELAGAIEDLRALANGVRPARLQDGLVVALRELAGRSPLPVRGEATSGPLSDEVEATAYLVAAEALTNVLKHADAQKVTLTADRQNGVFVLTVHDDGVGGADLDSGSGTGSGLRGLADRVAALGGGLKVESPDGAGTLLTMRLPCES